MSKKSRKRNKKILGALAAGLGAMALMKGRQGTRSVNPVGGVDQIAADAVTGTDYPGANKAVVADTAPKTKWISPRMKGKGPNSGVTGQNIRAGLSQPTTTAVAPPSILNPYRNRVHVGRGNFMAKGGRVKGGGKAKRGLGRAFTKGRK